MRYALIIGMSIIVGCAQLSANIPAADVSIDEPLTCTEITQNIEQTTAELAELSAAQDRAAKRGITAATIGTLVFPPAFLLCLGGNHSDKIAELKGEVKALQALSHEIGCEQ